MRNIILRRSVVGSLLVIGIGALGMALLVAGQRLDVFRPLVIGLLLGVIVSLVEIIRHRAKGASEYKLSMTPFPVIWILMIVNIMCSGCLSSIKFYLWGICGFYCMALAASLKVYQIRSARQRLTWTDVIGTPGMMVANLQAQLNGEDGGHVSSTVC